MLAIESITKGRPKYFYLYCPYREKEMAKKIPGRIWDPRKEGWKCPCTVEAVNMVKAQWPQMALPPNLQHWYNQMVIDRELAQKMLTAKDVRLIAPKSLQLFPFQRIGVGFLIKSKKVLLGDEMGLGKTVQASVASAEIRAKRVLVVCLNSLKDKWELELAQWMPGYEVTQLQGTKKKREETLRKYKHGVLIANFESLRHRKPKEGEKADRSALIYLVEQIPWDVLIVDESHTVKNRKNQQAEGLKRLASIPEYVFLLTGTPILNRVGELWFQLHMLHPDIYRSYWSFVKEHAKAHRGIFGWEVDQRATNPEKLRKEIAHCYLRRLEEEVWKDLPKVMHQTIPIEMEPRQRKIYQKMEEDAFVEISESVQIAAPLIISQMVRLQQIAISPALIGGPDISPKAEVLVDIARGTDRKIVVFSKWNKALGVVARYLEEADIGHISLTGEDPIKNRQGIIDQFQEDPEKQVLLTNIKVGGVGHNITAATIAIFLDLDFVPALNHQAYRRLARYGQTKTVHVLYLIAKDSIEEWLVNEILAKKEEITREIVDGKEESLTSRFVKYVRGGKEW